MKEKITKLYEVAAEAPSGMEIMDTMLDITQVLLHKNVSYGDSALQYNSIFGNLTAEEALYARLNDKLARIANNTVYESEGMQDAVQDCIGYMVLLTVLLKRKDAAVWE